MLFIICVYTMLSCQIQLSFLSYVAYENVCVGLISLSTFPSACPSVCLSECGVCAFIMLDNTDPLKFRLISLASLII